MGSSGQQLYSLSWGDFGSSLTSAIQLLRGEGDLVDVTLAAGGRSFPAHKIVLSAASPFLLDILKSTPCQHPVVMIPGISSDDLESLLEFVYRGEVSVEPSQLPSLLQAAHCLDIHGLTPPTVLTENGEEVPPSAIPEINDTTVIREEAMNSCVPNHRRKKRRKSSSSCTKWPRLDNPNDNVDRQNDDRHDYGHKNDGDDGTHRWSHPGKPDEVGETKQHLHHSLLHGMQYPSLHTGGLLAPGIVTPTFLASSAPSPTPTTTSNSSGTASKIRGASDCPGQCALCGATLRQARNLRRHLLTSCKYRFNSNNSPSSSSSSSSQNNQQQQQQQQQQNQTVMEIKPDIDVTNYGGPTYMTDSGGSNSCEPIVLHTSPLPSPATGRASDVVANHQNGPSPTIAR